MTPSERVLASWREHARREFLKEEWPRAFAENVHFYNIIKTIDNLTRRLVEVERKGMYPTRYVTGVKNIDPDLISRVLGKEVNIR